MWPKAVSIFTHIWRILLILCSTELAKLISKLCIFLIIEAILVSIEIISFSAKSTTQYLCHSRRHSHIKMHVSFLKDVVFIPHVFFEETTMILFHKLSFWFCLKYLPNEKLYLSYPFLPSSFSPLSIKSARSRRMEPVNITQFNENPLVIPGSISAELLHGHKKPKLIWMDSQETVFSTE